MRFMPRRNSFILAVAVFVISLFAIQLDATGEQNTPLRILPIGDSITRGSYLAHYESGPHQGQPIGLPHPLGGGWRKPLQDKLRAAGLKFEFVGEIDFGAFGRDGKVDALFQPHHHGLAGFSNESIRKGGKVPAPGDVLESLSVKEIHVADIEKVLRKHHPDIILLMSGANGFDAAARDRLIRVIGENSSAHLMVATLPRQQAPRRGWQQVEAYNASLPAIVDAQSRAGKKISAVDMYSKISANDLLPDGVHPNQTGMNKIADVWFQGLLDAGIVGRPSDQGK